ncbi:OprD family outer membrane porin [Thiocapsa bogorovii]|uniref:OprD family outer membrane porin n=1 Tax=Thiocapsa bogorovii TaxID=521689 RepID=UPI001E61BD95|nr:OprD family outer membrane porin [Thiocapsa bogorovii]UHD17626.1 OprD family porin [Thiocapsa bogorovii]
MQPLSSLRFPRRRLRVPPHLSVQLAAALLLTAALSVHASEPDYMTQKGAMAESPEDLNVAIDYLGRPDKPALGKAETTPTPNAAPPAPKGLVSKLLDGAKLGGQFRTYYLERLRDGATDSQAWAAGGSLGFKSGLWRERVGFGLTLYTSQPVYAPKDKPGSGLLAPVQDGYTVLGESYLLLRPFGTSHLQLWRQGMELPYVNKHDTRMTPNTFEAYLLFDRDAKRFNYVLGYIDKIRKRTETTWQSLSSAAGADANHGAGVLGARWRFGEGANIGAVDIFGIDTFNTFYTEATRALTPTDDEAELEMRLSAQYTDQRSVGEELIGRFQTYQVGGKFDIGAYGVTLTLAYTDTGSGADIQNPWGGVPSYNSVIVGDFDSAGERAWRVGAAYDFGRIGGLAGVSGFVNYTAGDTPDSGSNASPNTDELDFTLDWRPKNGSLEGLWLRGRVAVINAAGPGAVDQLDFRVILNYDFNLL